MKKSTFIIGSLSMALLISSCSSGGSNSPVTPAADRPTFVYFFTDG